MFKKYFIKFSFILEQRKVTILLLFILSIFLLYYSLFVSEVDKIKFYLLVFFFSTYICQIIILLVKSYILYITRCIIISFFLLEVFFSISAPNIYIFNEVYSTDTTFGYTVSLNIKDATHLYIKNKDTLYNYKVFTDYIGRRTYCKTKTSQYEKKTKHVIFIGGTETFGVGQNDESTIPFIFEQLDTTYNAYNYGVPNYAPHNIALSFKLKNEIYQKKAIPENKGICLYTFCNSHLSKTFGGSNKVFTSDNSLSPIINIENNEIILKKRHKLQEFIFWFINSSRTFNHFNIEIGYPKTDLFYKRFADIVNYCADKYLDIKPNGIFYIGVYPYKDPDLNWTPYLRKNIRIINIPPPTDLNSPIKEIRESYYIDNALHPSKKFNKYYVKNLIKFIKSDESFHGERLKD